MSAARFLLQDFNAPSLSFLKRSLALQYRYFTPRFEGAENVDPKRPALFVGNHAIFGVVDSPLFVTELYRHTGVYPRSLGDHIHFDIPVWGKTLLKYGAVPGTRENCGALMQSGQFVLVFPGGAREVAKRQGEQHKLVWKQRTGFARMAIEHGYDILPFASVGCDVSVDIFYDGEDFKRSWWGKRLLGYQRINKTMRGGDVFMPLARGLGPTAIPRPEPFWFKVGAPISTQALAGQADDDAVLWQLRKQVAGSINDMIADLSLRREAHIATLPAWHRWLLKR